MLLKRMNRMAPALHRRISRLRGQERGAALAAVLGVMAVTVIISLAVLSATYSAIAMTSQTKAGVQAQAAADAGVAEAMVHLARGECLANGGVFQSASPHYRVTVWIGNESSWLRGCPNDSTAQLRLISTGYSTEVQANVNEHAERYREVVLGRTVEGGGGAALYSYGSATFNSFTVESDNGDPANVHIPDGSITCTSNGLIRGDLIVEGDVRFTNNCTVEGTVYTKGIFAATSNVHVHGDVIVTGVNSAGVSFASTNPPVTVGGTIYANGHVSGSEWGATNAAQLTVGGGIEARGNISLIHSTVAGNLWSGGEVRLQNTEIGGNVIAAATTGDSFRIVSANSTRVHGTVTLGGGVYVDTGYQCGSGSSYDRLICGLVERGTVQSADRVSHSQPGLAKPAEKPEPVIPGWVDVDFVHSDWSDFNYLPWPVKDGSNAVCQWGSWNAGLWKTYIQGLTTPTVFDLRGICSTLYIQESFSLRTDIAFIGTEFNTQSSFNAQNPGTKFWFIQPDTVANTIPTCPGQSGTTVPTRININSGVTLGPNLQVMLYTPCGINFASNTTVYGQIYGGKVSASNNDRVIFKPTSIPGVNFSGAGGTDPVSADQFDIVMSNRNRNSDGE